MCFQGLLVSIYKAVPPDNVEILHTAKVMFHTCKLLKEFLGQDSLFLAGFLFLQFLL